MGYGVSVRVKKSVGPAVAQNQHDGTVNVNAKGEHEPEVIP